MKITICGSAAYIDKMEQLSKELAGLGHEAKFPPVVEIDVDGKARHFVEYYALKKTLPKNDDVFWKNHTQRMKNHFDKVAWSDAVLIANYDKNGIKNYIGPNTLMEMGVAFHENKKIYLLFDIPDVAWKEEILGMRPVVINNNFSLIV